MSDIYNDLTEAVKLFNPVTVEEKTADESAEDAALSERAAAARKFLSRDLRKEADDEAARGLPKNRLLRALTGFGIGVNDYFAEQNKRPSYRDKIYNEIKGEWEKQAPILTKDVQASESLQGKRQLALAQRIQAAERANAQAQMRLLDLGIKKGLTAAQISKIGADETYRNAQTDTERIKAAEAVLQLEYQEKNGAKMGTTPAGVVGARAEMNDPALGSFMDKQRLNAALLRVLPKLAGAGGAGGSMSERQVIRQNANGEEYITNLKSWRGGNAGSSDPVGDFGDKFSRFQKLFGLGGSAAPNPVAAPQVPALAPAAITPRPAAQARPQLSPQAAAPAPTAGASDPILSEEEARRRRLPPGATYLGQGKMSAAAKQEKDMNTAMQVYLDMALNTVGSDDKGFRKFLADLSGPGMNMKVGPLSVSGAANMLTANNPHRQKLAQALAGNEFSKWMQAIQVTGKAMSIPEIKMLDKLFGGMTEDKNFFTDTPTNIVSKLATAQIVKQLVELKKEGRLNPAQDYTKEVEGAVARITRKWRNGKKVNTDDVNVRNALPSLSSNPVIRKLAAGK